jgi:hypothetical protein
MKESAFQNTRPIVPLRPVNGTTMVDDDDHTVIPAVVQCMPSTIATHSGFELLLSLVGCGLGDVHDPV